MDSKPGLSDPTKQVARRGMVAVILAQFFSAFGDNALFFITLALLISKSYPSWAQPAMQMGFLLAYILFAPFVGQLADAFPKSRVMMLSNTLKVVGVLLICLGFNPFLGYGLVGVAAAFYSPAKYGILSEFNTGEQLVKANGWMEASTIAAILSGSIAGGLGADWDIETALWLCVVTYIVATFINFYIPRHTNRLIQQKKWVVRQTLVEFIQTCCVLWRDADARLSLLGTSLFWGAGITLRFLLVLWVPTVLGIHDNQTATILNAIVAIGIVIGAGLAGKWITLGTIYRCLPAGLAMGVAVAILSLQSDVSMSYGILVVIGALGGFFVVPLNALLQDKGVRTVGAGKAVAIQNLSENLFMMGMLALYTLALQLGASVIHVGIGFGILFSIAIVLISIKHLKNFSLRCF